MPPSRVLMLVAAVLHATPSTAFVLPASHLGASSAFRSGVNVLGANTATNFLGTLPACSPRSFGSSQTRGKACITEMREGAARGIAEPPTSRRNPANSVQSGAKASGRLAGVGVAVFPGEGGRHVVAAVVPYTLARQCGVRSGDVLLMIDGVRAGDLSPKEVWQLLLGEAGTVVVLLLEAPGGTQKMVTLTRHGTFPRAVAGAAYAGTSQAFLAGSNADRAREVAVTDLRAALDAQDGTAAASLYATLGILLSEHPAQQVPEDLASGAADAFRRGVEAARAAQDPRGEVAAFEGLALTLVGPGSVEAAEAVRMRNRDRTGRLFPGFVRAGKTSMRLQADEKARREKRRARTAARRDGVLLVLHGLPSGG
eukprot:CAMPEP_0180377036 /NCGR_PEP_ID=MMETSP0989-20121125/23806_1 /TAXON_ID=697907 /ORGANISM="non described non described, Strain CCMP2293" /LENGTH=368 /DNA_ID=CAMNT_0022375435 /DNA_START=172 /DNA_END=1274 /DNA_ORIENTATION=-